MSTQLRQALAAWRMAGGRAGGCLVIVRHGATAWNHERRMQGLTDVPLNAVGRQQAREAAAAVSRALRPAAIYSSPLSRARETATAISRMTGVPVETRAELVERACGAIEGMLAEEIDRLYPDRRRDESTVPGLEPYAALQQRAVEALTALAAAHNESVAVVVSHGAFINAFLAAASRGALGTGVTNLANGSITVGWQVPPTGWYIEIANIVEHLTEETGQTLPPAQSR
jgi:broad specificity phosphatase PhoE